MQTKENTNQSINQSTPPPTHLLQRSFPPGYATPLAIQKEKRQINEVQSLPRSKLSKRNEKRKSDK